MYDKQMVFHGQNGRGSLFLAFTVLPPSTCNYSVGRPKHVRLMAGGLEGDMFIGPKAEVRMLSEEHRFFGLAV